MSGLAVTRQRQPGTRGGPSINLARLKKHLRKKEQRLEERLKRLKYQLANPEHQRGGKGGHEASCETSQYCQLWEQINVAGCLLAEVRHALERIQTSTYNGLCGDCEKRISLSRLKARPGACYCIGCQRKIEKEKKREKNGGSSCFLV